MHLKIHSSGILYRKEKEDILCIKHKENCNLFSFYLFFFPSNNLVKYKNVVSVFPKKKRERNEENKFLFI